MFLFKIIISCTVHCIVIQAGINMAYSTILEDGLKKDFSLTMDQISWIGIKQTILFIIKSFIDQSFL
jgi:hypothetical protein